MATEKTPKKTPKKTPEQIKESIEDILTTFDVHLRAEKIKKFGIKEYFERFAYIIGTPVQMVSPLESEWKSFQNFYKDVYGYTWSVNYTVDRLGALQMVNIKPPIESSTIFSESPKNKLQEKKKAASKVSKVTQNQIELSPALMDLLKAPKVDLESLVRRVIFEAVKISTKKKEP